MEIAILTDIHYVLTLLFQLSAAIGVVIVILLVAMTINLRRSNRVLLIMNDTWRPVADADRAQHEYQGRH